MEREKYQSIGEELRARARWMDKHRDGWVQREPTEPGMFCAAFNYSQASAGLSHRVFSSQTAKALEKYLPGYLKEHYYELWADIIDGDEHGDQFAITSFNDDVAETVDDVIVMLEKAAAELG